MLQALLWREHRVGVALKKKWAVQFQHSGVVFLGDNIEFETPPKIAVNPDEAEPENLLKLQRKRNFTPPLRIILDPP